MPLCGSARPVAFQSADPLRRRVAARWNLERDDASVEAWLGRHRRPVGRLRRRMSGQPVLAWRWASVVTLSALPIIVKPNSPSVGLFTL